VTAEATTRAPDLPAGLNARAASWVVGAVVVTTAVLFFVCLVPALRHWMMLPVTLCGVLVAPDVVDWARKQLDVLDPQAVVALMGMHFFFLAPILHVIMDYWPRYEPPAEDWLAALGRMAVVNVAGLLVYRIVLARPDPAIRIPLRRVERGRVVLVSSLVLLAGITAFAVFIAQFGGIGGYVDYMTSPDRDLTGYGLTVVASSSFPFVALMLALVVKPSAFRDRRWLLVFVLLAFVAVQFLVGGLRGSRASVIWPLLIAIGMCHLLVVPVRRRVLLGSLAAIVGFMYVYGFYKSVGREAIDIFTGARTVDELSTETGRDLPVLLLGDLGRADIQALTLERVGADVVPLRHGATYLGDIASLLPGDLVLGLPDKVAAGTDMLYGAGSFDVGHRSSRIYGLTGEAMLNFGVVGAVGVFLPFAWLVRWSRACHRRARGPDGSVDLRVLAAVLPIALVITLTSDLDNVIWFLANHVAVIGLVVLLSRVDATRTNVLAVPRPGSH
jgi:hypothetical protein